jgi:ribosomal protein L37AE/L43A
MQSYFDILGDSAYSSFWKRWFKEPSKIKHQDTCLECGRSLVNTYIFRGVWRCRRCWEKTDSFVNMVLKDGNNQ